MCESGRKIHDIRCVLTSAGIQAGYIKLNGDLIYPLEDNFEFAWSKEYDSRRAQPQ